ncbi:hypothetical protein Pdw03_1182 [Penicillium digitatum]|uniref:Uncharacterized protein n=1 Tax=Penicillium digitatum TaxID=36651 RepID=A0A7T6XS84_PENDI|nr:hypothetical protein Pdw03_1182 [Penicillium digitatum]
MLRRPSILVDSEYDSSTPLVRSIEDHNQIRWGSISSTQPVLSGPEQIRVYHEWIDAGKPHNIILSYCMSIGRGTTPVSRAIPSPKYWQDNSKQLFRPVIWKQFNSWRFITNNITAYILGGPANETYPQLLEYLALPDAETDHHTQSSQFKHQLRMAIKEIESNRASIRDKVNIQEDFSRLQCENAQIKAYLDSRHSPRDSAIPNPSTASRNSSRPASEQRGRAWDSLAIDMF